MTEKNEPKKKRTWLAVVGEVAVEAAIAGAVLVWGWLKEDDD